MSVQGEAIRRPRRSPFPIPVWLGFCVFLGITLFFLWQEHRAHLFGALPWVFLLLCPVVHLFTHRGHGGHPGATEHERDVAPPTEGGRLS